MYRTDYYLNIAGFDQDTGLYRAYEAGKKQNITNKEAKFIQVKENRNDPTPWLKNVNLNILYDPTIDDNERFRLLRMYSEQAKNPIQQLEDLKRYNKPIKAFNSYIPQEMNPIKLKTKNYQVDENTALTLSNMELNPLSLKSNPDDMVGGGGETLRSRKPKRSISETTELSTGLKVQVRTNIDKLQSLKAPKFDVINVEASAKEIKQQMEMMFVKDYERQLNKTSLNGIKTIAKKLNIIPKNKLKKDYIDSIINYGTTKELFT
jgi:hypothetical protein